MNRRIFLQVAGPALVIGLLLLTACGVGAWYVSRLQTNLANVLSENVRSLEAAQDLEIRVRQLRFHTFLALMDPSAAREIAIKKDRENFEASLRLARDAARSPEERECVREIESGFRRYQDELAVLPAAVGKDSRGPALGRLIDAHPVAFVVQPCQKLLKIDKEAMENASRESSRVSDQARLAMLILGLAGPAGGIAIGYGVARGLSRTIYKLSVRLQNMAQRLDQDVTSVNIVADGDLKNLDDQLQVLVQRVEEVAERVQRHQREMFRAEQLSAVGQLGASVAHEVRNPLTGIKMLVDAALRTKNSKTLTREDLEMIREEIDRVEQRVQEFLDFARLPTPERTVFDIREAISQAADLVAPRARQQRVEVTTEVGVRAEPVYADRGQLHTVLVNLLLNALDAMPRGGRLLIALSRTPQDMVQVQVSDTGTGIPAGMTDRLFSPFASSKPTGTGLGLSISRRILDEHGGGISGENRPEGGARFAFVLPRAPDRSSAGDGPRDPDSLLALSSSPP